MKYIAESGDGQTFSGNSVQEVNQKARLMDVAVIKITAVSPDGKRWEIKNVKGV